MVKDDKNFCITWPESEVHIDLSQCEKIILEYLSLMLLEEQELIQKKDKLEEIKSNIIGILDNIPYCDIKELKSGNFINLKQKRINYYLRDFI